MSSEDLSVLASITQTCACHKYCLARPCHTSCRPRSLSRRCVLHVCFVGVLLRMFQDEPEEGHPSQRKRSHDRRPFRDELEEHRTKIPKICNSGRHIAINNSGDSNRTIFRDEGEERCDEMSSSSTDDEATAISPNSQHHILSIGWQTLGAWIGARQWAMEDSALSSGPHRPYNSSRRQAASKAASCLKPAKRSFRQNGCDPGRLDRLLRKSQCHCTKRCFWKVDMRQLAEFLNSYWKMPKREQDGMLTMALTQSDHGKQSVRCWQFLGHDMSPKCIAALLGHNRRKFYAALDATPDSRYGRAQLARHASVHAFMVSLCMSVAETMPNGSPPCITLLWSSTIVV